MMETQLAQIGQQVSHLSRPQGRLSGQPEANPKGHINVIILRSGKQLDEPKATQGQGMNVWSRKRANHHWMMKLLCFPKMRIKASMKKSQELVWLSPIDHQFLPSMPYKGQA